MSDLQVRETVVITGELRLINHKGEAAKVYVDDTRLETFLAGHFSGLALGIKPSDEAKIVELGRVRITVEQLD